MTFDDKLMGSLIQFVSSHEVGHSIGLRHNMAASSATPVEKLRDKAWVEANGHTVSIMDYARFNYVAQPEDRISEKDCSLVSVFMTNGLSNGDIAIVRNLRILIKKKTYYVPK